MMVRYRWREGCRLVGDAEEVARHLTGVAAKYAGDLLPSAVVESARSEASPIHDYFEWDDTAAAAEYRQEQARHLIRSIQVVVIDGGEPVRAFHNVVLTTAGAEEGAGRGYVTVARAASEEQFRAQVVRRLYAQARAFVREARAFEEFAGVVRALEALPPLEELERQVSASS